MRHAHRTDANHAEILSALRKCGAFVIDTSDSKRAGIDCFVAFRGRLYPIEIKDGAKPASKQQLTESEVDTREGLYIAGVEHYVVRSADEALRVIGATW
jgi:hypothetical protein